MNIPRAVIDTNVIVSALLTTKLSPPREIYLALKQKRFLMVASVAIFNEIEDVINRPALKNRRSFEPERVMRFLLAITYIVKDDPTITVSPDEDDNKFLSACIYGKADYLVTGDKQHLLQLGEYAGASIITPRDFIEQVFHAKSTIY